jgi:hypothetical protein
VKKFRLLRENGFEKSLNNSTLMGSNNVFSPGGGVLNERETTWKNEA